MIDRASVEFSITKEDVVSHELDQAVLRVAEFLAIADETVSHGRVDPETGRLDYSPQSRTLPEPLREMGQKYMKFTEEYLNRHMEYAGKVRGKPGVLDVKIKFGAVVIIVDTAMGDVEIPGELITKNSSRGYYFEACDSYLGAVVVDINPEKRQSGVSPTTTLIHELHHHTVAVADKILARDPAVKMASAQRDGPEIELYPGDPLWTGKAQSRTEMILADREKWESILGRPLDEQEIENIKLQMEYLFELHSSFLQRKPSWFDAREDVYSSRKSRGKHWEMVGENVEDQKDARRMLALMQTCFAIDQYLIGPYRQRQSNAGEVKIIEDESLWRLNKDWSEFFYQIGGVIGASRSISQCWRLALDAWHDYTNLHADFFTNHRNKFDELKNDWIGQAIATEEMREIL